MGGFGSGKGSGGVRAGAGRPKTGRALDVNQSFRLTLEERYNLKQRARAAKLSVSAYLKMMSLGSRGEVERILADLEKNA